MMNGKENGEKRCKVCGGGFMSKGVCEVKARNAHRVAQDTCFLCRTGK